MEQSASSLVSTGPRFKVDAHELRRLIEWKPCPVGDSGLLYGVPNEVLTRRTLELGGDH